MYGTLLAIGYGFEGIPHDGFQPDRGAFSQDRNIAIDERTIWFSNVFMFGQMVFP